MKPEKCSKATGPRSRALWLTVNGKGNWKSLYFNLCWVAQSSCPMEIVPVQNCLAKLTAGSTHWQKEMDLHYQRRWEGLQFKACNFNSFSSVFKSPEVWPHVVKGSLAWAVLGRVDSVSFLSSPLSPDRPERWDTIPGCCRPEGRAFQTDSPSALQTVELKHEGMRKIQ